MSRFFIPARAAVSDTIVKEIEKHKPDILFIIGIFSWHFNIVPMMFAKAPVKILSTRGMLHAGALSQKRWKKKIFLHIFKLLEYHYKVRFHATDQEERDFITRFFGGDAKVSIAGNFPNQIGVLPVVEKKAGHLKLVTIALISPMKNIDLVLEALGQSKCSIEYDIYGSVKDEDYWQACREKIKSLPENIRVTYHKEIEPREVKTALSAAHVFVLPSRSENFGHAIYEALSAGRPVITSRNTPWNDLKEMEAGMNVSISDPSELGSAIDYFAGIEAAVMERWSTMAHLYAERAIDVKKIKGEYLEMFFGGLVVPADH